MRAMPTHQDDHLSTSDQAPFDPLAQSETGPEAAGEPQSFFEQRPSDRPLPPLAVNEGPAKDIDDVIARLDALVSESLRDGLKIGYFAALYLRVTLAVKRAIIAGDVFRDNARMEELDVVFANRFLRAWEKRRAGEAPSAPWQAAFAALEREELLVVQHLLLGMNAHINLDLGVAAAEVMRRRGQPIHELRADFVMINEVLARLTRIVQVQLGELSTAFGVLERVGPELQAKLAGVVMSGARDEAWDLAVELMDCPDVPTWRDTVRRRAKNAALIADKVIDPSLVERMLRPIVSDERKRGVRFNVQVIAS